MRAAEALAPAATLSITKNASRQTVSAVGQTVTYTFTVWNTSATPITGVSVADTQVAPAGRLTATCTEPSSPPGACTGPTTANLAPNQTATFTGTYTVTPDDLDNGEIDDYATASGTDQDGHPVDAISDVVTVEVASLRLVKSASPTTVSSAGNVVTYSFRVTNTGTVPLTSVNVDETAFTGAGTAPDVSVCATQIATLTAGQSKTCTVTYTVVAADLTSDGISNTAIAEGSDTDGDAVNSPRSTATVEVGRVVIGTVGPTGTGVTTVATTSPLAFTGVDSQLYLVIAAALVGIGFLLIVAARRRRP